MRAYHPVQALWTFLVALLGLVATVATFYLLEQAPAHHTLGTAAELLPPTLVALGAIIVCCALLALGAWRLWRAKLKMAAQLLGILAAMAPLMIWQSIDAANVLLDEAQPTRHPSRVIAKRRTKGRDYLVLQSWRETDEELLIPIDAVGSGYDLAPGTSATIVVGAGAFGRPYALALEH